MQHYRQMRQYIETFVQWNATYNIYIAIYATSAPLHGSYITQHTFGTYGMWMSTYIRNTCYFFICHIYVFFVWGELQTCTPHLHTVAALPWEVQKVIFQQDSTVISIKQLFFSKISKHLHKHAVIGFKQRQMSVTD